MKGLFALKECEYCAQPERFNLGPAVEERPVGEGLPAFTKGNNHGLKAQGGLWHYEKTTYGCLPPSRVRCRKSL